MLGSLVVAQMEMVACEGLDGPMRHGAGCASALQSAVALSCVPRRGGAKCDARSAYAVRCDTERTEPNFFTRRRHVHSRRAGC